MFEQKRRTSSSVLLVACSAAGTVCVAAGVPPKTEAPSKTPAPMARPVMLRDLIFASLSICIVLLQHEFGLQRAGGFDALQDRDDPVGFHAEAIEPGHRRFQIG